MSEKENELAPVPQSVPVPKHLTERDRKLIASLIHRKASIEHVCTAFSLSEAELMALSKEEEYQAIEASVVKKQIVGEVTRDASAELIEQMALLKTKELMPTIDDPEKAMRIAKMANAAKKSTGAVNEDAVRNGQASGAITEAGLMTLVSNGETIQASFAHMRNRASKIMEDMDQHAGSQMSVVDVERMMKDVTPQEDNDDG